MDNVKLFNMDCFYFLEGVKDGSIDLVLIDPPYNISRESNFSSGSVTGRDTDRFRISTNFGDWDKDLIDIDKLFKEFYRVLKSGGTIISFYDLWKISYLKESMEKAGFKQLRFIEWLKTNPVPINSKINYLTNSREIVLLGVKGSKPTFNSKFDNGLYSYPICRDKGRFHPTQKPLKLIEELILKHSNKGDLILDSFSGSGTTAVACLNTERYFVGCELDEEYYNKSLERIERSVNESPPKGGNLLCSQV